MASQFSVIATELSMYYAFNSLKHGVAFIVCFSEFEASPHLDVPGNNPTANNFCRTFDYLGFRVSSHFNLTHSKFIVY